MSMMKNVKTGSVAVFLYLFFTYLEFDQPELEVFDGLCYPAIDYALREPQLLQFSMVLPFLFLSISTTTLIYL